MATSTSKKKQDPKAKEEKGVKGGRVIATKQVTMPVNLNDQELLLAGAKLAACEREARTHEVEASSVKAGLNAKAKDLDKKLREQSKIVESRQEERAVLIQVEEDKTDKRYVLEFRLDTVPATFITRRLLRDDEKQRELPLNDKKGAADLVDLALQCIKSGLTAADVKALAEKKKIAPEALTAAIADQQNKAGTAAGVLAGADPTKKSAAQRIAEKLFTEGVASDNSVENNAKLEDAAKAAGVPPEDVFEELRAVEKRLLKQDPDQKPGK